MKSERKRPLPVFLPDDRVPLENVSYPFSVVGLLVSGKGVWTGTFVDEDLVLTASHCIPWSVESTHRADAEAEERVDEGDMQRKNSSQVSKSSDYTHSPPSAHITAGRMRFIPGFTGKHAPLGTAEVTAVFAFAPNGNSINAVQAEFDMAVLRLDQPLGRIAGCLGTREWNEEWAQKQNGWINVGYPEYSQGLENVCFYALSVHIYV